MLNRRDWPFFRYELHAKGIDFVERFQAIDKDTADAELWTRMNHKYGECGWTIRHRGNLRKPKPPCAGLPKRDPITKCRPTRTIPKPLRPAGYTISNYAKVENMGLSKVSKVS